MSDYYTEENGYTGYIMYPKDHHAVGRYLSKQEVDAIVARQTHFGGCGAETRMNNTIAETYARDPKFYGATYCVGCQKHIAVEEFTWSSDNEVVGS